MRLLGKTWQKKGKAEAEGDRKKIREREMTE